MFTKLRNLFPANRVAALLGLVGAAAAFLVTIQTSLIPGSPAAEAVSKAIVMLGSIAGAIKIIDKFLDGSQNWDMLLHGISPVDGTAIVVPVVAGDITKHPDFNVGAGDDEEMGTEDAPQPEGGVAGKPGMAGSVGS